MSTQLADGLLALYDRISFRLRPAGGSLLEWLRTVAQPPPGVELRASDGTLYSGLVIVERSKIVVMLAVATGQSAPQSNYTPVGHAPSRFSPPTHTAYGSPRDLFEPEDDPGDGWPLNDPFRPHR